MKAHRILFLVWLLAIVCLSGCANFHKAAERKQGIAKLSEAKQGALMCIVYAYDHGGQFPSNLADTAVYAKANTNFLNQLEADFDLVYRGVDTNLAKPYATILLKEKQPWQTHGGKWLKAYAFADGHAEIHAAPDGKFEDWENERIIKP
jgi:prepilin-type processing-associated H-X9-DG protein